MNITSFASKSSYCSKGAPPHVCYDKCIPLPAFFSYFSASLLFTLLHSGAIPPVVVKTRGLNEDFSMSITLWLYLSFFSFSYLSICKSTYSANHTFTVEVDYTFFKMSLFDFIFL